MFTKPLISHLQVFTISHHQFSRIINIFGKVCSRKSKFGHLSSFSASKNSFITPSYCRKCQQNQVFFKSDSKHPYCKNACEGSRGSSWSLSSLQCLWSELWGGGKQFSWGGNQQCRLCVLYFRHGDGEMPERDDCSLCCTLSAGSCSWQVQ